MRVLITGASSGIGRAAVDAFTADGAQLALLARSADGLPNGHVHVPADVTDADAVDAAVAEAERRLGGLDVLVLCAAVAAFGPFREQSRADFDQTVATTLGGSVNCVRAALPALERSGGVIVSTGSIASTAPLPTFSAYATAKHGLRGFFNTLRVELAAEGSSVRVAQVHPGVVDTPLWDHSTSADGTAPRTPPVAYSAETVAAELVARAHKPRPETTVGTEAMLEQALLSRQGVISDAVLRVLYTYLRSGDEAAPRRGSLWAPVGRGLADGAGTFARDSLTQPLRRLLPWR